jgi:ABC-type glutathione transport system ATPase component
MFKFSLVILDEPTTGTDRECTEFIWGWLRSMRQARAQGGFCPTVILITHAEGGVPDGIVDQVVTLPSRFEQLAKLARQIQQEGRKPTTMEAAQLASLQTHMAAKQIVARMAMTQGPLRRPVAESSGPLREPGSTESATGLRSGQGDAKRGQPPGGPQVATDAPPSTLQAKQLAALDENVSILGNRLATLPANHPDAKKTATLMDRLAVDTVVFSEAVQSGLPPVPPPPPVLNLK